MSARLPKTVESHERHDAVKKALASNAQPLFNEGKLVVAQVPFTEAIEKALVQARNAQRLERGVEHIEKLLGSEAHGIRAVREKQGQELAVGRVSRILLIADGGTERFYHTCEVILSRHADRVLGLRIAISSEELGTKLFGEGKVAKALLVADRDAVSNLLLALA